jgi:hypothetical protein
MAKQEPTSGEGSPKPASAFQQPALSGYIHRHQLEERFKEICDGGAKVIVLHGLPGMGKTWLAEQLTWDYEADKPAPFIDASRKEDRKELLSREDISALACTDHAPPFLVIDNIDSAKDLKKLLPRHTKSVIVATCRRAANPSKTYAAIHVDKMEKGECIEMAKSRLPDVSDDDADYLVSSFNGYPLVIDHVCALFPNQAAPLRRLCDELKRDGTRLAGQGRTEDQSIFLAILQRTMRLVKQRDKNAYELVVIMSFIDHVIYKPLLLRYFERLFNFHARSSATIAFTMAIGLLERFSLIQFDSTPKGFCIMHPFTQEVLSNEFDSRRHEVLLRILIASNDLGEEIKAEGDVGGIFIFGEEGGMKGGYTWGSGDMMLFVQNTKYNTEAILWMKRHGKEFFDSVAGGSRQASSVLLPLQIERIDSGHNPRPTGEQRPTSHS